MAKNEYFCIYHNRYLSIGELKKKHCIDNNNRKQRHKAKYLHRRCRYLVQKINIKKVRYNNKPGGIKRNG